MRLNTVIIEAERKRRKQTKKDFAASIGFNSTQAYSYIIKGASTSLSRIHIIADKLGVSPIKLLILKK